MIMKTQFKAGQYSLKEENVKHLFMAAKNTRDSLIAKSLYYAALRRFEACNLQIENVDTENGRMYIEGKGNKIRIIPVKQLYPEYFHELMMFIGNRKVGYVFTNSQNKRLTTMRINQIVAKMGKEAKLNNPNPGLKYINPHSLRHSQARHLKNRGLPIEFIQNYLGHSSFKTTMDIYGTLGIQDMENIAIMANENKIISINKEEPKQLQ